MNRKSPCMTLLCAALAGLVVFSPASADQVTDRRMQALQDVLRNLGKPQTIQRPAPKKPAKPTKPAAKKPAPPPAIKPQQAGVAQICWTPRVSFSKGGSTEETAYGPNILVARYDGTSTKSTKPLKAVWTYNDGANPISTGDCKPHPNTNIYDNGISYSNNPLQPGIYQVKYMDGSRMVALGRISILAPTPLGNRTIEVVAQDVLLTMQKALDEVAASRASNAADYCKTALPLIGTAMQSNPDSQDMRALYEMAEAIIALHKLEKAAEAKSGPDAVDWCFRAQGHAQSASNIAQNPQLKATATEYSTMLQQTLDQLSKPANKKGK